jgi:uncharacterized membrane protein YfcA
MLQMDLVAGLTGVTLAQLALVGAVALFASLVGGVAGYGTGVLLPLVLVPITGAETVVPIIAITALFTNTSRAVAFRDSIDAPRTFIVLAGAIPTCVLGAYGFTLLTGRGALLVIGLTLMASVPLRRLMHRRGLVIEQRGLAAGAVGYGVLVGGTTGSGVLLLAMLMASGLAGAGVIATDAAISIVVGMVKIAVFGIAGIVDSKVMAFSLMIGAISMPGAFLAKALVDRMPVRVHTAILDAVVLFGGVFMVLNATVR